MLRKNSQRTVKCKGTCAEREFYWYHDDSAVERAYWCDEHRSECRRLFTTSASTDGSESLPPGTTIDVHITGKYGKDCRTVEYVAGSPVDRPREEPEHDAPRPKPVIEQPTMSADDGKDALWSALQALVGSSVDESAVREIAADTVAERLTITKAELDALVASTETRISDALADINVPTVVSIQTNGGDVRTLDGVAHAMLPNVIRGLNAGLSIWLVGPAGTGKSTIARQAAQALEVPFYAMSFSPDTLSSDLVGYQDGNGNYVRSGYRDAYEHGGLFLADEVDNGHPSILAKLNDGLSSPSMAFPDGMVDRHPSFRVVAAANTFGTGPDRKYVGRMQLDAATLDRFVYVQVPVDEALEMTAALGQAPDTLHGEVRELVGRVRAIRQRVDDEGLDEVVSPRASIQGAALLHAGFPVSDVLTMAVRKGMGDDAWSKVTR